MRIRLNSAQFELKLPVGAELDNMNSLRPMLLYNKFLNISFEYTLNLTEQIIFLGVLEAGKLGGV